MWKWIYSWAAGRAIQLLCCKEPTLAPREPLGRCWGLAFGLAVGGPGLRDGRGENTEEGPEELVPFKNKKSFVLTWEKYKGS